MGLYESAKHQYQKMLAKKNAAEKERGSKVWVEEELCVDLGHDCGIRFGVIGTGHVFDRWMHDIKMLPASSGISVKGVAAGKSESASKKAQEFGIPVVYQDYSAMLADPEINAIYVATPNHLHAQHVIEALKAGKHVLCEKPIAVNTAELHRMMDEADKSGCFLMEGMWMRTLPMIRTLQKVVSEGIIGEVRFIETSCCNNDPPEQYPAMYSREKAGGALMDVGCYGLHFIKLFFEGEPEIKSSADLVDSGVDRTSIISLKYPKGTAVVAQSIGAAGGARAVLHGTEGSIEVPLFLQPDGFNVTDRSGYKTRYSYRDPREKRSIGYAHEILHFAEMVQSGRNESCLIPRNDTIAVAVQMEECRRQCGIRLSDEEER